MGSPFFVRPLPVLLVTRRNQCYNSFERITTYLFTMERERTPEEIAGIEGRQIDDPEKAEEIAREAKALRDEAFGLRKRADDARDVGGEQLAEDLERRASGKDSVAKYAELRKEFELALSGLSKKELGDRQWASNHEWEEIKNDVRGIVESLSGLTPEKRRLAEERIDKMNDKRSRLSVEITVISDMLGRVE